MFALGAMFSLCNSQKQSLPSPERRKPTLALRSTVAHRGGVFVFMNLTNLHGLKIGWAMATKRKKKSNWLNCANCGKLFYRRGNRKLSAKNVCCSKQCAAKKLPLVIGFNIKPKTGPILKCPQCGENFQHPPTRKAKFCSRKCFTESGECGQNIRGKNHYNWQDGATPKNQRLRTSPKGRAWTIGVFIKDNFTCRKCGYRGNRLQAHHIKPWALFHSLRFALLNGITLCKTCHKQHHKKDRQCR